MICHPESSSWGQKPLKTLQVADLTVYKIEDLLDLIFVIPAVAKVCPSPLFLQLVACTRALSCFLEEMCFKHRYWFKWNVLLLKDGKPRATVECWAVRSKGQGTAPAALHAVVLTEPGRHGCHCHHDWVACWANHWLLWMPDCLPLFHPKGVQAGISHSWFKLLSADLNGYFPCQDPGAINGAHPISSSAVLPMDALPHNPCPLQHSCCDFCKAVTDGRKTYAEVLPSLLVGELPTSWKV